MPLLWTKVHFVITATDDGKREMQLNGYTRDVGLIAKVQWTLTRLLTTNWTDLASAELVGVLIFCICALCDNRPIGSQ